MKKLTLVIFIFLILTVAGKGYSFHYDFSIEDIPMMIMGTDVTNASFYSFYNIANLTLKLYFSDQTMLKFRLKDTYFDLQKTNNFYIDRLSLYYREEGFGLIAGRDFFIENDGIIIANLADGLKLDLNLLQMKERIYVYYSGLLPMEINQFEMGIYDLQLTNGPQRLFMGLALEKTGLLTESMSLLLLYSMDVSTNKYYNPFYAGLNIRESINAPLSVEANLVCEAGNVDNSNSILAFGGDAGIVYLSKGELTWGGLLKFAIATGEGEGNNTEQFRSFGLYNTGFVLNPYFSNLFMIQAGLILKALEESLSVNLNYYYMSRMSTNDTVYGFYDGKGNSIGNEISGSVVYNLDANFSLFLHAGYFMIGDAFTSTANRYKVFSGISIKL